MKKSVFTLVFCIALATSVMAQYKPFQFGFRVAPSVNWAEVDGTGLSNGNAKLSFSWGFLANYYFVENYGLSTGFNWMRFNNSYDAPNFKHEIKVECFEIPILLKMRTDQFATKWRLYGEIGYGMGIMFNNKDNNDPDTFKTPYDYRSIRHSMIISIGVEFKVLKSSVLTAGIVYDNNFSKLSENKNDYDHKLSLDCVSLQFGFLF